MKTCSACMMKLIILINLLGVTLLSAQEVNFELLGDNLDPVYSVSGYTLSLGINATATSGPALDNFDIPGAPPQLFATFKSSVLFAGNETPLIKDVKHTDNTLVWQIRLEFGDSNITGLNNNIILKWTVSAGQPNSSQFAAFSTYSFAQLVDGAMIIDLKSTTSHTFIAGSANEVRTAYIVLRKQENSPPVATNDNGSTLPNPDGATDNKVEIDVLANDFDVDGLQSNLSVHTITQAPSNGTATKTSDDKKITYKPNPGFAGPTDTFTYTISDNNGSTPGISQSATVSVMIGPVVFTRSHNLMVDNSKGLIVSIIVSHSVVGENIVLTEILPPTDDAMGFYAIPAGGGRNGLAIDGTQPTTVSVNGNSVVFTWDSASLPASPFTMKYLIKGGNADKLTKQISGSIVHGTTEGPELTTTFTPGFSIPPPTFVFHPSDANQNGKITLVEFLNFAGPVARAFQRGTSGAYCFDGTTLSPDTGSGCTGTQQFHSADTNQNKKITLVEYLNFAGPAARAFQRGISGSYCIQNSVLSPDLGLGCQ